MRPTEPFRQEHKSLIEHVEHLRVTAKDIADLPNDERGRRIDQVLDFLLKTLIPHAQAEERVLYPAWAELVGYADAAASMVHDHEAIVARINSLKDTPLNDTDRLQELLYGLYALISVHFRKEEDLQLPVFDEQPAKVVERLLNQMGAATGHVHA